MTFWPLNIIFLCHTQCLLHLLYTRLGSKLGQWTLIHSIIFTLIPRQLNLRKPLSYSILAQNIWRLPILLHFHLLLRHLAIRQIPLLPLHHLHRLIIQLRLPRLLIEVPRVILIHQCLNLLILLLCVTL